MPMGSCQWSSGLPQTPPFGPPSCQTVTHGNRAQEIGCQALHGAIRASRQGGGDPVTGAGTDAAPSSSSAENPRAKRCPNQTVAPRGRNSFPTSSAGAQVGETLNYLKLPRAPVRGRVTLARILVATGFRVCERGRCYPAACRNKRRNPVFCGRRDSFWRHLQGFRSPNLGQIRLETVGFPVVVARRATLGCSGLPDPPLQCFPFFEGVLRGKRANVNG